MWYMVALKIITYNNSFLVDSIEPGQEGCRKSLYYQVKRPSDIVADCPK